MVLQFFERSFNIVHFHTAACQAARICITVFTGKCGRVEHRTGRVGPPEVEFRQLKKY